MLQWFYTLLDGQFLGSTAQKLWHCGTFVGCHSCGPTGFTFPSVVY